LARVANNDVTLKIGLQPVGSSVSTLTFQMPALL